MQQQQHTRWDHHMNSENHTTYSSKDAENTTFRHYLLSGCQVTYYPDTNNMYYGNTVPLSLNLHVKIDTNPLQYPYSFVCEICVLSVAHILILQLLPNAILVILFEEE